ncbi:MAG: beta-ketoacyl-[acyl-carrier-protein] synthase family protein [Planctomycetales bacterium]|nr:beta-ketoacyl-[acyl-carrier-protein] synthase family protein [Planctomycetales bacterium]
MASAEQVVITGLGVVSPLGNSREAVWESFRAGRSGVRSLEGFEAKNLPIRFGGEVRDFDPKAYVRPRKSLKVMSRDIQLAFAAAQMASEDAGISPGAVDPERLGVIFGADMMYCDLEELEPAYRACYENGEFQESLWGERVMGELNPLWMLKYLPNMPACHIGIAHDARGPSNSITLGEASSLAALAESVRVLERGAADVMIVGGGSSRIHPMPLVVRTSRWLSQRNDDPAGACRPFELNRDGMVYGEGAGALILEPESRAVRRGARILARIGSYAEQFGVGSNRATAIRQSLAASLRNAGVLPAELGFVSANGLSTREHDAIEAQAIRAELNDKPTTALKSYFGNLGAAAGAVELISCILALDAGEVPRTLNYETPDPECPVNVVHAKEPTAAGSSAVVMNQTTSGQAMAVVIRSPNA